MWGHATKLNNSQISDLCFCPIVIYSSGNQDNQEKGANIIIIFLAFFKKKRNSKVHTLMQVINDL